MMEIIENLYLDSATLIIMLGGVLLITSTILVVLYIRHLRSKIDSFENPKYGFLGKTIYPVIGMVLLSSVLFIAGYGIISPETPDIQAEFTVDGKINATVTSRTLALVNSELKFTPYVNGQPWGSINDTFDIYWKISGPVDIEEFELGTSKFNQSEIMISVPKGIYSVDITVIYQGESFEFNDRISY